MPAERVEALRRSFDAMMVDPEFLEDAKRLRYEITPRKGEKLQQVVEELMNTPKRIIDRTVELTK